VYSAVIRRTKDGKPPIVKPPFYAYALLQVGREGWLLRLLPRIIRMKRVNTRIALTAVCLFHAKPALF
jgi:hypothetical protein